MEAVGVVTHLEQYRFQGPDIPRRWLGGSRYDPTGSRVSKNSGTTSNAVICLLTRLWSKLIDDRWSPEPFTDCGFGPTLAPPNFVSKAIILS